MRVKKEWKKEKRLNQKGHKDIDGWGDGKKERHIVNERQREWETRVTYEWKKLSAKCN